MGVVTPDRSCDVNLHGACGLDGVHLLRSCLSPDLFHLLKVGPSDATLFLVRFEFSRSGSAFKVIVLYHLV